MDLKYNIFSNQFDISDFKNEIFFTKNFERNFVFEVKIKFVAKKILFLNFSTFSNDAFFHLKIIKTKNAILNNKNFDFNFLITNNENIMTKLNDFVEITKNSKFEYVT